ncbi:hypothetical protein [Methylocystis echinoides]
MTAIVAAISATLNSAVVPTTAPAGGFDNLHRRAGAGMGPLSEHTRAAS